MGKYPRLLTRDDIVDIITDGVNRNIIVFDADSKPGELSNRLVYLMSSIAEENAIDIYGKHKESNFDRLLIPVFTHMNDMQFGTLVHGLYLQPIQWLDTQSILHDLYEVKLGATYPTYEGKKKDQLVIAMGQEKDEILLGAF